MVAVVVVAVVVVVVVVAVVVVVVVVAAVILKGEKIPFSGDLPAEDDERVKKQDERAVAGKFNAGSGRDSEPFIERGAHGGADYSLLTHPLYRSSDSSGRGGRHMMMIMGAIVRQQ